MHINKTSILTGLTFLSAFAFSQRNVNYEIKLQGIYGNIIQREHVDMLIDKPVRGGELDVEFRTMGEKPWHQYFNFPKTGIGLVGLDLGNPAMLGQLLAVYPYIDFRLLDLGFFKLNVRGGAGASFLNKRFNNTATDLNNLNTGNAAIGSIINIYFAGGGNFEIPLFSGLSFTGGYTWNHASNGSFYQPNAGINMLNGSVGISYFPNYKNYTKPHKAETGSLPQKFTCDLILSGGARELYYKDGKMFPTGSVVFGIYRQLGNNLRLGLAADGFYDGVYDGNTKFKRTYLNTDELKNKLRVGVSLQPELVLGKMTAGVHFGVYIYNPLKNLEPFTSAQTSTLNKPLIYPYSIEKEDGWFYTRASLKYLVTQKVFLSLGLKTHLYKAEFIEWGLGYRL